MSDQLDPKQPNLYTKEQILNSSELQGELLKMASEPHDLEDGGMYVPARHFPKQVADRTRDMMAALGVDNVMLLTDLALGTLFWAMGERMAGKLVGSVNITDDFEDAPLPFLENLDSSKFDKR